MSVRRVIVAGSRKYNDRKTAYSMLDSVFGAVEEVEIVCGEAQGADTIGREWGELRGSPIASFPAKWDDLEVEGVLIKHTKTGKPYNAKAGFLRNSAMADYAGELPRGALVAFWDGQSKGTKSMIDLAKRKGLEVKVFFVDVDGDSNDPTKDPVYEHLISQLEKQWHDKREYGDEQSAKSNGLPAEVREQDRSRWEEPGLLESALRAFD